MPPATAKQPIVLAKTAMISGLAAKRRAVAAGMISSETTSNKPTTFIITATINAINARKNQLIRSTATPSTRARSSWIVIANSGCQSQISPANASPPPPKIQPRSVAPIARMSPNKYATRSIRTA